MGVWREEREEVRRRLGWCLKNKNPTLRMWGKHKGYRGLLGRRSVQFTIYTVSVGFDRIVIKFA